MSLSPTRRPTTGGSYFSSPPSSPGTRYSTVAPRPTTRLPIEGEEEDDEDEEEVEEEETGLGVREGGRGGGGDRHTRHVQVQALVEKRTLNLDYIRRVHDGGKHWLNTVILSKAVIQHYVQTEVPPPRPLLFFHLGLSLAKLLDVPPSLPSSLPPSSQLFEGGGGADGRRQQEEREEEEEACVALLRALAQIFEEMEYHTASGAVQGMKLLLAKPSDSPYPEQTPEGSTEPINPRIYRFGTDVVFENFFPPHVPFPLGYVEVLDSLCHILSLLYQALGHRHAESLERDPVLFETLVKIDAKIKHHVINPIAKELTDLTARLAKQEMEGLREGWR